MSEAQTYEKNFLIKKRKKNLSNQPNRKKMFSRQMGGTKKRGHAFNRFS